MCNFHFSLKRFDLVFLETIVSSVVVVPELCPGGVQPDAELDPAPYGQSPHHQLEPELVRGPVPLHVASRLVTEAGPVIHSPPYRHGLGEGDVEYPDNPRQGGEVRGEGILQTDLVAVHRGEEGGGGDRLAEHTNELPVYLFELGGHGLVHVLLVVLLPQPAQESHKPLSGRPNYVKQFRTVIPETSMGSKEVKTLKVS